MSWNGKDKFHPGDSKYELSSTNILGGGYSGVRGDGIDGEWGSNDFVMEDGTYIRVVRCDGAGVLRFIMDDGSRHNVTVAAGAELRGYRMKRIINGGSGSPVGIHLYW